MTTSAPFRHKDGTNCWTVNCSRGNMSSAIPNKKEFFGNKTMTSEETVEPTYIDAIASMAEFEAADANDQINRGHHTDYPFSIFKYSQMTTFKKDWNPITMASRGLIINDETGEILARPFGKFFNYSEGVTPAELMVGPMNVSEKLDGSLGITYMTPDGLQISTAGGFQSPQAEHATALYREKYEGKWEPRKGTTYLYEIIYPENRIVVNYGDEDDLHLLGAVNIKTGKSIPLSELKEWKWKRATEYSNMKDIDTVVNAPERSNHEGYIIHFPKTDTRVKFKHDEYLRHHRYATGINSRRIWEMLREGDEVLNEWTVNAPEEFEGYIKSTQADIQSKFDKEKSRVLTSYKAFTSKLPKDISQRDFAMAIQADPEAKANSGYFFKLRAKGELDAGATKSLWDSVKPDFEKSFWSANSGVTDDDS
jgi:RNA ligase